MAEALRDCSCIWELCGVLNLKLCTLFVMKVDDDRMAKALKHCPCTWEESNMLGKACATPPLPP